MPWFGLLILALTLGQTALLAQDIAQADLKRLSLEELMAIDVTSVARTEVPLRETAAAVTVITSEDIRRAGVTNIPEALRLVPGLQVARQNSGAWAISARGFNSVAANKLLVMIDGRTVYSPVFSGTFWEVQDYVLHDIDRIEVVRGPGGTLYGSNAVNGIIHIITRSAHNTRGGLIVAAGGGAEDLGALTIRGGSGWGPNVSHRVFGKYFYRDQATLSNGQSANDSVRIGRTGFRVDGTKNGDDWTVQGDVYDGLAGIRLREDAKVLGGNVLARWTRRGSNNSEIQLQTYFERSYRRVPLQSDFDQRIFDIDFQHAIAVADHNLSWGAEYRRNRDETRNSPVLAFTPQDRTYPMASVFLQDEITFANNRVRLLAGSKLEHNEFTGLEIQPSVRATFQIRPEHGFWAALSRAVRTPTRFDTDIRFVQISGNPGFRSEELIAYELGFRSQPEARLSIDVATFYNVYDQLRSLEFRPAQADVGILNNLNGKTYGIEFAASYDALEFLRFRGSYSFLGKELEMEPGKTDLFAGTLEGNDPRHQFSVQGSADLTAAVELDSTVRFVGRLPAPDVARYFELDARLGWNPFPGVELSVVGQNLLHDQHPEFGSPGPFGIEIQRNVYGRALLRF